MTTLAANAPRVYEIGNVNEFPMVASDIIFEGAAVGLDGSGNAKPIAAANHFVGFARRKIDNSSGSAGDKKVEVIDEGLIEIPVTGADATKVGDAVFATDDNAFTLTKDTGLARIGYVWRHVSGTTVVVHFMETPTALTKIADPAGGKTTDAEARTAIDSIIDALEAHGITLP